MTSNVQDKIIGIAAATAATFTIHTSILALFALQLAAYSA